MESSASIISPSLMSSFHISEKPTTTSTIDPKITNTATVEDKSTTKANIDDKVKTTAKMPSATLLLSPVVSRRTSYQEVRGSLKDRQDVNSMYKSLPHNVLLTLQVVHRECRPLGPHPPSITCPVTRLASRLAEWLVVLQKVSFL